MISLLKGCRVVSIIGLEKNVGKTTTLNYIVERAKGKYTLGLTSIGLDGETIDSVTATEKPRIYVHAGTLVATARQCFRNVDVTKEILEKTNITTPVGDIIIFRALSDGYVEIAGPSITKELETIKESIMAWGSDIVIIDGALSRKSLASPAVAEATILATGAAVAKSMVETVAKTVHAYKLLSIEAVDNALATLLSTETAKTIVVKQKNSVFSLTPIDIPTSLGAGAEVFYEMDEDTTHLFLRGAVTDRFIDALIKNQNGDIPLTLVVQDGTKLFISEDNFKKLNSKKIKILAEKKINVVAITINPTSPFGYKYNGEQFKKMLQGKMHVPIFNVKDLD